MRAVMLAAGIGRRLQETDPPAKVLLEFDGETLLARHLEILAACGVQRMDLVVGYRAEDVAAEVARLDAGHRIETHFNPHYAEGPILSLWTARTALTRGEPVIFMDADVLYDHRLMRRLVDSRHENCFLMDRNVRPGEDPVKLCMQDGLLVDFHKRPKLSYEWGGEWIGFARFTPRVAAKLAGAADRYVAEGRREAIYEDAFRDVLLAEPPGTFAVEDVTGLPWAEIDFPEDLERAHREILPRLLETPS